MRCRSAKYAEPRSPEGRLGVGPARHVKGMNLLWRSFCFFFRRPRRSGKGHDWTEGQASPPNTDSFQEKLAHGRSHLIEALHEAVMMRVGHRNQTSMGDPLLELVH